MELVNLEFNWKWKKKVAWAQRHVLILPPPLQSILNSCVIHLIGQPSVRKLIEGESWLEGVPVLSQPAPSLLEICTQFTLNWWIGAQCNSKLWKKLRIELRCCNLLQSHTLQRDGGHCWSSRLWIHFSAIATWTFKNVITTCIRIPQISWCHHRYTQHIKFMGDVN